MSTKGKEYEEYDYDKHEALLREFFAEEDEKYQDKLHDGEYDVMLDELGLFDEELEVCIERNTLPYIEVMERALIKPEDLNSTVQGERQIPEQLLRQKQIHIIPREAMPVNLFRDVEPRRIGELIEFDCVVTFVSEVLPEVMVATYYCEYCGEEKILVVSHGHYNAPGRCDSPECIDRNAELTFVGHRSRFLQARLLLVQEQPLEVPAGGTPRSMECIARSSVEVAALQARPGENLRLTGCLIPILETSGRITAQFMILHAEAPGNSSAAAVGAAKIAAQLARAGKGNPEAAIESLIKAFAPAIYGSDMAKLACLCALVGGCPGGAPDAPSRASVNVLLVGDPGAAKSELLKFSAAVAPRSAYVSGRGASAAGLTAAVVRLGQGTEASEYALEPGALVLADGGVCCIDEFDKLDEADRAAIYEALEEETVSIAKAGVAATLRAETTVLAAANPISSRWDDSKSVSDNIGLPEALASRFDCIFILRDRPAPSLDKKIAEHVTKAHMADTNKENNDQHHPEDNEEAKESTEHIEGLKQYLEECKTEVTPQLKPEFFNEYVESYVEERRENPNSTARVLLSLIRLSQAIAKLRKSVYVEEYDIKTARDLLRAAAGGSNAPTSNEQLKRQNSRANAETVIRGVLRQRGATTKETLVELASDRGVPAADVETALENLLMLGAVAEDAGVWSLV